MTYFRDQLARRAERAAADLRSPIYEEDRPTRFARFWNAAALAVVSLLFALGMATCLQLFAQLQGK